MIEGRSAKSPPPTPLDPAKVGSAAALSGGAAAIIGGFLLAMLCCWGPALIVSLGIGS